jgi:hypothetical protein
MIAIASLGFCFAAAAFSLISLTSRSGEKEAIDVDEIISALGKTMADLTSGFEPSLRQPIIEDLMTEISRFEAEDTSGLSGMHH